MDSAKRSFCGIIKSNFIRKHVSYGHPGHPASHRSLRRTTSGGAGGATADRAGRRRARANRGVGGRFIRIAGSFGASKRDRYQAWRSPGPTPPQSSRYVRAGPTATASRHAAPSPRPRAIRSGANRRSASYRPDRRAHRESRFPGPSDRAQHAGPIGAVDRGAVKPASCRNGERCLSAAPGQPGYGTADRTAPPDRSRHLEPPLSKTAHSLRPLSGHPNGAKTSPAILVRYAIME